MTNVTEFTGGLRAMRDVFMPTFAQAAARCAQAGVDVSFDFDKAMSSGGGDHRVEIVNALNFARGMRPIKDHDKSAFQTDIRRFVNYVNTVMELARR